MVRGTPQTEHALAKLEQQAADACRVIRDGVPRQAPPALPQGVVLPDQVIQQLARQGQRQERQARQEARQAPHEVLDNGKEAYGVVLRDPTLSMEVPGLRNTRVLTPAGMERVLETGLISQEMLPGGMTQGQATQILQAGGEGAQRLTAEFSNFMNNYSARRAERQAGFAASAISGICRVVEPSHPPVQAPPPVVPPQRAEPGFGQPRQR